MSGEQYLAPEICAECGGKCCQFMSGATKPEDFMRHGSVSLKDVLMVAFSSGNWVIDWWEGDPRGLEHDDPQAVDQGYYIRPRVSNDRCGLYCPSWNGTCCFWMSEGCTLLSPERPWSCRVLEPREDGECISHGDGRREAAVAWIGLHDVIKAAASEVEL